MTLALAIWALALGLTLFSTYLTLRHFSRPAPHLDTPFALYPVSILKPLKGRDEGLKDNLESFFRLDYPEYELVFSVADSRDPALAVVRDLMLKYPRVSSRLIVGAVEVGPNPKVNNMIRSYEEARHDWILINDSNVRVPAYYLKRMVAHIESGVGMVTSVVSGQSPQGAGGALEAVFLNTFYARGMIFTKEMGRPCVMGKSMLFQRSVANRFGGIKVLGRYLAEDFMAGEAMRRLGLRVEVAVDAIDQYIGEYGIKDFWARHLRWGRIRKAQTPVPFAVEPLTGCLVSSLLGAWGAFHLFGISPAHFILMHWLIWSACDAAVLLKTTRSSAAIATKISASTVLAWFGREFLAFPLWLNILAGNTVNWRGARYRLLAGGLLEPR